MLSDEHGQASSGRESRPLLAAHAISKSFPGVQALRDVSLSCSAGKVHGLVGGNGAGKSTLVSIITGVQPPDAGRLMLDGEPFAPRSPHDALAAGIAAVYQELTVLPNLNVVDNIFWVRSSPPRRVCSTEGLSGYARARCWTSSASAGSTSRPRPPSSRWPSGSWSRSRAPSCATRGC